MDFYAVLDQVLALLRQRGRVSYRALKRQFDLDDAYLDDLKVEIIEVHQCAVDQEGTMLVWTGEADVGRPPRACAGPGPTHLYASLSRREDSDRPVVPWKASASRSPCCLPISKAPWNSWPTATPRTPDSCSIRCWSA